MISQIIKKIKLHRETQESNKLFISYIFFRKGEFKENNVTTQIMNLPGGIKRKENEIKDDKKVPFQKLGNSQNLKLTKDFKSSISCLPGKMNNENNNFEKSRVISVKRFETNDIFNKNNSKSFIEEKKFLRVRSNLDTSQFEKKLV